MMVNPPSDHPVPPTKKSHSDEGSDHKSRRETMRGFALPRMAFECKKRP